MHTNDIHTSKLRGSKTKTENGDSGKHRKSESRDMRKNCYVMASENDNNVC